MNNRTTSDHPLILDGAMGTELLRMGIDIPLPLWSAIANETHSDIVYKIHQKYVKAGADILTTNSFRTTPYAYQKAGFSKNDAFMKSKNNLKKAVSLAKKAVLGNELIAGSIAPIDECYSPELFPGETQFKYSIEPILNWFQESDVDIILFETMGNAQEISYAVELTKNCDVPIWLSLILEDESYLLDGTPLNEVLENLTTGNVEVLLFNCNTIQVAMKAIQTLKQHWDRSWGVYPNLGFTNPEPDGRIERIISDEKWKFHVQEILREKPDVIGACCGSTPEHIKIINEIIHS